MEPQPPLEAHIAWKMKFTPYVAQVDGSFCPVDVTRNPEQSEETDATEAVGRVIALPVVATVVDGRSQISTHATAVLIHTEPAVENPPLSIRPMPSDSARAAILSLMRIKGRFSA